jgi:hypothetical protein
LTREESVLDSESEVYDEVTLGKLYLEMFRRANSNVTCVIRMASPEWADEVLGKQNQSNRQKNTSASVLADHILRGDYSFTGEPVIFDTDGQLRNGQNRLIAVTNTKIAVPVLIVRGVDPETFKWMDRLTPRKNGGYSVRDGLQETQFSNQHHPRLRASVGDGAS